MWFIEKFKYDDLKDSRPEKTSKFKKDSGIQYNRERLRYMIIPVYYSTRVGAGTTE